MISTSDLKRGAMMELDGQIVQVLSYEHQKIGRGSAQVRLKVKNIRTGAIFDTTAQAGSKWPRIRLDQRDVQYLYSEGDLHYVMDKDSYEQFPLSGAQLGDAVAYLKDGMELEVLMYEGEPVGVDLPLNVVLEVASAEPGFKGDTATGGTKPATLETGKVIQVPLFVNTGDLIRVDTRDGSYIERV
ncbi:MAG TPA: elongation factor P [Chloroflexota bacterium]|nr:elongation factor P [Chloroflexota bacterium]